MNFTMKLWVLLVVVFMIGGACGFPRPADVPFPDSGGSDASSSICNANQSLRCSGNDLVRCNNDGTAEISDTCPLGCNVSAVRCNDINPSNGLATYLDMASNESDLDLGATATINTDD